MGYVPEWARGSQAKTSTKTEHGIKKVELFHNAPKPGSNANQTPFTRHYADGSEGGVSIGERIGSSIDRLFRGETTDEVNVRGEKIGKYEGDDPIVKMRMGMTDYQGNDLRIPKAAQTTTSMAQTQDNENGPGETAAPAAPAADAPKAEAAKPGNFGSAFAAARKSGAKTFEFGGKSYTTEMKGEKKADAKPESKPSAPVADDGTRDELKRMLARRPAPIDPKLVSEPPGTPSNGRRVPVNDRVRPNPSTFKPLSELRDAVSTPGRRLESMASKRKKDD